MVINPVFSKSGKGLKSILKHQTEKPNKNFAKTAQELAVHVHGGKISGRVSESPPNHLSLNCDK